MLQLLKRDFSLHWRYLAVIVLVLVSIRWIGLPDIPFSTYLVFLYILLSAPFYFEGLKNINRFLISLPVSKRKIVFARYINSIAAVIIGTSCLLFSEAFLHHPAAKSYAVILIMFTFLFSVIAVALPVFYFFEKMWEAILCQVFIFIVGNIIFFVIAFSSLLDLPVHFVLGVVDWNPTVVLLLFSFVLLWISYGLSCRIFEKKDH